MLPFSMPAVWYFIFFHLSDAILSNCVFKYDKFRTSFSYFVKHTDYELVHPLEPCQVSDWWLLTFGIKEES